MYNTAEEIIQYIGNAKKHTPVKVYVKGENLPESDEFHIFGDGSSLILIGDIEPIQIYLEKIKREYKIHIGNMIVEIVPFQCLI